MAKKVKEPDEIEDGTGLMRIGSAVLGETLIDAAQTANREALQSQVVGRVQEFLTQLHKQRLYQESTAANIALLQQKLAAVKAGAFTLSTYGSITFTDRALNESVTRMAECVNCGHAGRK